MPSRPQPLFPEQDTKPYWDAVKQGKLTYQYCRSCTAIVFTPRSHCTECGSEDLEVRTSAGKGTIYTHSVVRQNRVPAFAELGAYALAYVDLDEGFRMLTNIVGVADPTKDVKIGQRVQVEFEKQDSGDYPIPVFRPIA